MSLNRPTFSVLVSSYNYQDYIIETVQSVLAQSYAPLEVIVVDDGSSDASVQRLQEAFGQDARVSLICQANGGQMSSWVTGHARAKGEWIALLDSDDLWLPNYLEKMAAVIEQDATIDYVYANMERFGARSGLVLNKRRHRQSRDLGLSMLMGACIQRWQGVATSGNVLRRSLLEKILQLPESQIKEWKSRPDDCLFYGSDILGGHKYYLAEVLVRHREHPNNALLEFAQSPIKNARYALRVERMLAHYREAAGFSNAWFKLAKYEFRSKPQPSFSEWWIYSGLALKAPTRLSARISQVGSILSHFLKSKR